jgi:hypothetical protein
MSHTKSDLLEAKTALIAYVVSKIKSGDWHAVQDGASDIREIDAKLDVLNSIQEGVLNEMRSTSTDVWAKRLG